MQRSLTTVPDFVSLFPIREKSHAKQILSSAKNELPDFIIKSSAWQEKSYSWKDENFGIAHGVQTQGRRQG